MRIRIRCRDNYHENCNWLKWQGLSRMFQENRWRVIRAKIGRSGSYADPPKHCSADQSDDSFQLSYQVLYRYDPPETSRRILKGCIKVSTLEACRQAENPRARDIGEATMTVGSLPGTNSPTGPEFARLLGVNPAAIQVGGKNPIVLVGENAVNRSEMIHDAFVFCTSAHENDRKMMERFGEGCIRVRDPHSFFVLVDAHLRERLAPREIGACVVDDVEYGFRRSTYRDHPTKHFAFLKPVGGEQHFEKESEVRALWTLSESIALSPEVLHIPELVPLLELL